jgi:peptidoglycan/LPS O-acetylase OafA/YrhL
MVTTTAGGPRTSSIDYIPQLDGLRAFAVLSVFVSHFIGGGLGYFSALEWGRFGVIHFFVLSGFLITSILLKNREKSAEEQPVKRTILKNFYIRRFLRIFPIYYLTIIVLLIGGYRPISENLGCLLTYTTNISVGFFDRNYRLAGHLWSLAVEEQFYLLYPFIILFAPKRHIHKFLWSLVAFSLLYKFVGATAGISWKGTHFNLPGCLDSLGLGGIYAYYLLNREQHQRGLKNLLRASLWIGIPLFIALQGWNLYKFAFGGSVRTIMYKGLIDLSITLPSIWLISLAVGRKEWLLGGLLSWSVLRYIGKISYGAYIYHNFVRLLPRYHNLIIRFFIWSSISLVIASLSWQLIEKPINRLRKRVPYLGKYKAIPAAASQ